MTWGRIYWSVALVVVSVMFLVPEVYALFTNMANTLSEYARSEIGLTYRPNFAVHHGWAWIFSLCAWWVFVGIITWHIWFNVNPK